MIRYGIQNPECSISFRLSKELNDSIIAACKTLDMGRGELLRRACKEFLSLYMPAEGSSVIEPHQL